jgi:hypothetical protein
VLLARMGQAALFALLFWRHPVPALWVLLLPNMVLPLVRSRWASALALTPLVALVGLGSAAWLRGMASGVWLAPWEGVVLIGTLALAFIRPRRASRKTRRRSRR